MSKVFIETYGCQMNVADSDLMLGVLSEQGFRGTRSVREADVILVNTCAVRENAEDRVFRRLRDLNQHKARNPNVVLGVCGCMAEHLKEQILDRAPYVDLVIGPDAYRRLPQLLEEAGYGDPTVDVRLDKAETYEGVARACGADEVSGFVTIQRGCDKFCTFCVVPYVRGRERGVAPREILRQVRSMAEAGYKEVTLLGQTVSSYRYEKVSFADLLRVVAAVDGIERVRFTSPYPVDFGAELIQAISEIPEVMPYIHLPVQSGSDTILESMRRGHNVAEFRSLVASLREVMPHIALSTDVIVGYPGESDEDYRRTYALLEELRFDSAFMFAYSERDMTYAAKNMPDNVPNQVKKRRLAEIIELQEQISLERYARYIGQEVDVLLARPSKRDPKDLSGRARDFKTTVVRDAAAHHSIGETLRVQVEQATSHTLIARLP